MKRRSALREPLESDDESGNKNVDQRKDLSESGFPIGNHGGMATFHSGGDVVPGDFVVNELTLGSGREFVKMESGESVLRIDRFRSLKEHPKLLHLELA